MHGVGTALIILATESTEKYSFVHDHKSTSLLQNSVQIPRFRETGHIYPNVKRNENDYKSQFERETLPK